ncbi:MAG: crotonase/enoyl-CoA hydratase family protein [Gammaproteobacteria bacterium]|nr:crotonase/enoyl-CoA hydratase family protein [Gammaproteobacteria bacterium]
MPEFQFIRYEVERGRARIELNRPDKRNALSHALLTELDQALWEADNDNLVHAVVLKGAGKGFCAGYDLTPQATPTSAGTNTTSYRQAAFSNFDDDAWRLEHGQRLRMTLFDMHKPVIAQLHGFCLAGGTDLALLCDMVIAAEDTRIGFPAVRDLGSPPNHLWLYHIGPQWTKRLLLTGDTITGSEAATLGLVMKALPLDQVAGEVEQLLDRLALIDTALLSANKRIVNLGLELMGARTLQRLAAENDARGHLAPSAQEFLRQARDGGLVSALRARDAKFGDGRAKVQGAELRDENGCLR